ncbi:MAG: hypothetical protein QOG72_91 [Sphingomonadales bacterium]|jgi:hypothetical protein|nr:hypothetical protein [Sphingomonadales bacterium]
MKKTAFALALLVSTVAFAQTDDSAATTAYEGDGLTTLAWETEASPRATAETTMATDTASTAQLVQPSNPNPERDARGIAVISAAAVAPAGWNGVPASAMGGPELDPVTGEAAAMESYPACTATVTDRCLQTYERGRH